MDKVILIVLDGLNHETASSRMGFMAHLVESGKAHYCKVKSALPSLSRPLYETILTGISPIEHGVLNNLQNRMSREESLFSIAKREGLRTGAAAYHWVSELYNYSPFDPAVHRIQKRSESAIEYGIFYWEDEYPDSHVFADAHHIKSEYDPHFLLVHSMNIDLAGHKYSSDSKEYRNSALRADAILSRFLPLWMEEGCSIIVTADHGMNRDFNHGGVEDDERIVPIWAMGEKFRGFNCDQLCQLEIAPMICNILGVDPGEKMVKTKCMD